MGWDGDDRGGRDVGKWKAEGDGDLGDRGSRNRWDRDGSVVE